MKPLKLFVILAVSVTVMGCRSRVVLVKLINTSPQPLYTIVVDYPGATFGVNQLDPGKTYQYAIKPQNTGKLKIQFTDASGHTHNTSGPELHQDDEGTVDIRLSQEAADADAHSVLH